MKSATFITSLMLLCSSLSYAQDIPMPPAYTEPKAVITPDVDGMDMIYEVGDIGWLSANGSDFDSLFWDVSKAPTGTRIVNGINVQYPTRIVGSKYSVTLIVAKVNPITKKPDIAVTEFRFEIFDPNAPDVKPIPDAPDIKPIPDDIKPIPVTDAFKAALLTITAKYTKIPAAEKPKVAAAFRVVAGQLNEGRITTKAQLIKATSENIVKQIGVNAYEANWIEWRDDMVGALRDLKLTEASKHAVPWITIANVLEGK